MPNPLPTCLEIKAEQTLPYLIPQLEPLLIYTISFCILFTTFFSICRLLGQLKLQCLNQDLYLTNINNMFESIKSLSCP